jgi:hypothetical protein
MLVVLTVLLSLIVVYFVITGDEGVAAKALLPAI